MITLKKKNALLCLLFLAGSLSGAALYMDDGLWLYPNGQEITRRDMVSVDPLAYDRLSDELQELPSYQSVSPERFSFDPSVPDTDTNTLYAQVHGQSQSLSDLPVIPLLSVGVISSFSQYQNQPDRYGMPLAFTSSNLPIVVIDTNGQPIVDDPKVSATIGIIYNGPGITNHLSDAHNEYNGYCGIEIRGHSSQYFPKKSFSFETWDARGDDIDASFLGFPEEEDFILYGPYSDKSLMNNVLAMKLGNDMGHYASRTAFVELVLNDSYRGLYVLMEKIKRDGDRVDISKLKSDDISGDDLTGGYIVRLDKGNSEGFHSKYNGYDLFRRHDKRPYFQFYYPEEPNNEQRTYISEYFHAFEDALASPNGRNEESKHYTDYINLRSFVDSFILTELSKDIDAYGFSTYFHKNKDSKENGRINAGPFWDFNLAFGNSSCSHPSNTSGWQYYLCPRPGNPFWWDRFLQDPIFTNELRSRWAELRTDVLKTKNILDYIDETSAYIRDAQFRNFEKWPVLGKYVWPNPPFYANAQSHEQVIIEFKKWIEARLTWMDNSIPSTELPHTLTLDLVLLPTDLVPATMGSVTVGIDIGGNASGWIVMHIPDWISVNFIGGDGDGMLTISYEANTTAFERNAVITLRTIGVGPVATETITITQRPEPHTLTFAPATLPEVPSAASVDTVIVTVTGDATGWMATKPSTGADWFTMTKIDRVDTDVDSLRIAYSANTETTEQMAIISVTSSGGSGTTATETITIRQASLVLATPLSLETETYFINPAENFLKLRSLSQPTLLSIHSLSGRQLLIRELSVGRQYDLPIGHIPHGIYVLSMQTATERYTARLIIQ